MDKETLRQVQLAQLKTCQLAIFKQFVSVCERLGLRYFVIGGTLIGAVRHQGFIPWDDDIDVAMPRVDYERFLQRAQALMPEYYFLQTFETDPAYPANFAKIRDSRTTFIETSVSKLDINHGVYIDIFPLDYYPENSWKRVWLEFRKKVLTVRVAAQFYLPNEKLHFIKNLVRGVSKIFCPSAAVAVRRREWLFTNVKKNGLLCNYGGAWGNKEIFPASWFSDVCVMHYEDLVVYGPKDYDKILKHVYGDYMQLPPEEERVGHHYALVVDLERPYTEYMGKLGLRKKGKDRRD